MLSMATYVDLKCFVCGCDFVREKRFVTYQLKITEGKEYRTLCGKSDCKKALLKTRVKVSCVWCSNIITRVPAELKRDHVFCSHSCSARFNNKIRKESLLDQVNKCQGCNCDIFVKKGSCRINCDSCRKTLQKLSKKRGTTKHCGKPTNYNCIVCKKDFISTTIRKTCGKECFSQKMSLSAINRDKNDFDRLKSIACDYPFNGKLIRCASKAEYSCLNYIENNYDVSDISRCELILPYELDGKNRNYNPDFMVKLKDETVLIAECKSNLSNKDLQRKWQVYYASIPMKKEALKKYCKENGCSYLWYHKDMNNKFYRSLSKEKLNGSIV